ncbi:helix-turn-helix domain-containing protein [Pseudopedobacter beijingensis]|uniref:Helix-turn-helix domain-containing protein n=1 Tax=Pseudopedobacter beijingensis TaxID=1207056 RepID=A0ABW4IFM0_9SPHI
MPISSEKDAIKSFGNKVRLIRKERKLSMEMLANIAEIELSQIYRIETGKINPKLTTILKIAEALEINPKELF